MSSIICSTCLSQNRTLVFFNRDKYGSLFGTPAVFEKLDKICWECVAMFRKLYRFKSQVLQAQKCIKDKSLNVTNLSSFSQLKTTNINKFDICCNDNEYILCDKKLSENLTRIKSEVQEEVDQNGPFNNYLVNTHTFKCNEGTEIKKIDDIKMEIDDMCHNVITIENLNITSDITHLNQTNTKKNDNFSNKISKKAKETYIIAKMTEKEMLEKREAYRQTDRYKNKVKYRCELCISGFFHEEFYKKHMKRHSEKAGKYICGICETRFTKSNYYKEHVESHYIKYICKTCGYIGYRVSEMDEHAAKTHGIAKFICRICKAMFPSKSRLRLHRETTHQAPVKCESCQKMFRTKNGLRIHTQQMHSHRRKSSCTVCGMRVRYLKSHMLTHSAAPESAYCAECDQKFSSIATYKSHIKYAAKHRTSDTVLKHECRICEARFINITSLKKHTILKHSSVRPFKCDKCGKGFEAQCKLKLHVLHNHEGVEKPKNKICHICGRGFNTKFMLVNHIRVHTGEKPFRCDVCGAAFSQKSSLTTHTRGVHLKIRPRPGRPRAP